ncbi:unnamed protein product [Merluccius merluccius]
MILTSAVLYGAETEEEEEEEDHGRGLVKRPRMRAAPSFPSQSGSWVELHFSGSSSNTSPGPQEDQTPGPQDDQTPGPQEDQSTGPQEDQSPGSHLEIQSLGSHLEDQRPGSHLKDQSLGSHLEDQSPGSHLEDQSPSSHLKDQSLGSHLEDQSLGSHLEDQSLGSHLQADVENLLLEAQRESSRSSKGSSQCNSPLGSQTPLPLWRGSEANSSQSDEDLQERRREVENLMVKNADWIWDWSSRPENSPPKGFLLTRPPRRAAAALSIRNTRVMKSGGVLSPDFLKLFLPSLILSHILAIGVGIYIGKRLTSHNTY